MQQKLSPNHLPFSSWTNIILKEVLLPNTSFLTPSRMIDLCLAKQCEQIVAKHYTALQLETVILMWIEILCYYNKKINTYCQAQLRLWLRLQLKCKIRWLYSEAIQQCTCSPSGHPPTRTSTGSPLKLKKTRTHGIP